MNNVSSKWQTEELSKRFLKGVRGALPLADKQIEIILTLVKGFCPDPVHIIDLGCGDGILGQTLLNSCPEAKVTFIDFSQPMLEAAKKRLGNNKHCEIVKGDFSSKKWLHSIADKSNVDIVVSGLAIHHQRDDRKKEIYKEIFDLLSPGGLFLNLEHVASASAAIEKVFDGYFVDHLYAYHRENNNEITKEVVESKYHKRPDKVENILAPVERQCDWLREIGFMDVDCFFKLFEIALFGGRKPS